jgi:hypothetical protein
MFTDFGTAGPYLGQMKNVLYQNTNQIPIVELFSNAPVHNPRAGAYLLAAYSGEFPPSSVFVCVVDPGVGSEQRRAVVVRAGELWFVGPDNGMFNIVSRRSSTTEWWEIDWRPQKLSSTFHGRDLFAPVAALLARGEQVPGVPIEKPSPLSQDDWPDDLYEIIYIDHFGNALTGVRAHSVSSRATLNVKGTMLHRHRTYSDVAQGHAFWYENANGLVEIAVAGDRASRRLGLKIGDRVKILGG